MLSCLWTVSSPWCTLPDAIRTSGAKNNIRSSFAKPTLQSFGECCVQTHQPQFPCTVKKQHKQLPGGLTTLSDASKTSTLGETKRVYTSPANWNSSPQTLPPLTRPAKIAPAFGKQKYHLFFLWGGGFTLLKGLPHLKYHMIQIRRAVNKPPPIQAIRANRPPLGSSALRKSKSLAPWAAVGAHPTGHTTAWEKAIGLRERVQATVTGAHLVSPLPPSPCSVCDSHVKKDMHIPSCMSLQLL